MATVVENRIQLHLEVTDYEVAAELGKHEEGPDRDRFAVSALRLGVLALRNDRGELDAEIRQEGERLLVQVREALTSHSIGVTTQIAAALSPYFDPATGALSQRLERLVKSDGDLDALLARHLHGDNSPGPRVLCEDLSDLGKATPNST